MAIILDLRQDAPAEDQLNYLKDQLELYMTELEEKSGGVQSIEMIPTDESLKLIITDSTGEKTEAEIQNANNIISVALQYYLSTSASEPTGGQWVADRPTPQEGYYIWQRTYILWADGSSAATSPVCPESGAKALAKAETALTKAQQAEQDAATAATAASNAEASASSAASSASDAQTQATAAAGSASAAAASASSADSHANAAALAAGRSATSALEAAQSASDAAGSASAAQGSASSAAQSASDAASNAATANTAAHGALTGLSTVQDVLGVLNWAQKNARYQSTQDQDIMPGKTYWTRSGAGTAADPYVYTPVVNPVKTDLNIYYEISGVDEAMADYINTHLALTDEGLSVLKAANGWRVLIKNDGVYIIDDLGRVVAKYKDSITLGNDDGSQSFMKEDYHSLQLFDKKNAEILNCDKYDSDSTYEVGDMVYRMDGGTKLYYKCKTAITVPIAWDSTYWERLYPSAYFHVSDLKDAHGIAEITETVNIENGSRTYVDVNYPISGTDVYVSVNGSDATVASWTIGGKRVTISQPALHAGDVVVITYETNDDSDMFACTFGGRKTGSNVGAMSVAMGQNVEASGINSHAEGCSTASGTFSHAEGYETTASDFGSHAEGYQTTASRSFSHAEGFKTKASGRESHAEGYDTEASGEDSHAEGNKTVASGGTSHAEGEATKASGRESHAEGSYTEASGIASHAQNRGTIAAKSNQTAIGSYNIEDKETTSAKQKALIIGNGTSNNYRSNALTVDWQGRVECGDYSGNLQSIFDIFYPVGSYYETSDGNFDPNSVWGGTWQLESEGLFHISGSASGTYRVGTQGGSTKHKHGTSGHTLTVDEIPSHRHQTNEKVLIGRTTAVFSNTPKYYGGNYEIAYTNYVGGGKSHSHGDTGETTTLPPYMPVYRWHRTA